MMYNRATRCGSMLLVCAIASQFSIFLFRHCGNDEDAVRTEQTSNTILLNKLCTKETLGNEVSNRMLHGAASALASLVSIYHHGDV